MKNFVFLFNLMIFYLTWLKNGAFEKNQIYLPQPGSKISHTAEFHRLFSPNLLIFLLKKLAPSPLKNEGFKGGEGVGVIKNNEAYCCTERFFALSTYQQYITWVELKENHHGSASWKLLLQTLPQKFWPQNLANNTDSMIQWYKNINKAICSYMKLYIYIYI